MINQSERINTRPLVKVCGITHQSNLDACIGMGVHFCGFIFHPESARYISPARASSLSSRHLKRVGVFVRQEAGEIIRIMREARLDFAQLHGGQTTECARQIGAHRVIRTLWPQRYGNTRELLDEMERLADTCAYFLLDAGNQGGGSGRTIDWEQLSGINPPRPWILAGGLSGSTLPRALSFCRPNGIDLNSGIEWAPGQKSASSLLSALHTISN